MNLKKVLSLTLLQLRNLFENQFPFLIPIANQSESEEIFKELLRAYISGHFYSNQEVSRQILLLIDYDGRNIYEYSVGEQIKVDTISLLFHFLKGDGENNGATRDVLIDLYFQFLRFYEKDKEAEPNRNMMHRWATGLQPHVMEVRMANKERMVHLLIQKMETKRHSSQHFHFTEGMSYEEKYEQVKIW